MILDIIDKKRLGKELTKDELATIFNGYLKDEVPDYQMSAFLMAVCIQGMSDQEEFDSVDIFIKSGEEIDLSFMNLPVADKHSTGGVGDKTTLIVGPIVASCGVGVIKASGRGLGYTGGTIDKLLSIPSMQVDLSFDAIKQQAKDIALVVTSQTANLTPLDKKVYALRDVSDTVSSVALIAISIMSKKIASGSSHILIDVKQGEGALLQDKKQVLQLCDLLKKIGNHYGKDVQCIISSMDAPLGFAVGNKVEVLEAISVLKNEEKGPLLEECLLLASTMIHQAKNISLEEAKEMASNAVTSMKAYQKFLEFVSYQHGEVDKLALQASAYYLRSQKKGTIHQIHALEIAKLALQLGAARVKKDDEIDYDAGVVLQKQVGDKVEKDEVLAILYTNRPIFAIDVLKIFEID